MLAYFSLALGKFLTFFTFLPQTFLNDLPNSSQDCIFPELSILFDVLSPIVCCHAWHCRFFCLFICFSVRLSSLNCVFLKVSFSLISLLNFLKHATLNKYILTLIFIYLEIKPQRLILNLLIRDTLSKNSWDNSYKLFFTIIYQLNLLPVITYSTGLFIELGRNSLQYYLWHFPLLQVQ